MFPFLFFCLEPTVKKNTWTMKTWQLFIYGNYFGSVVLKVTWTQSCLKSFSTITRHIDNSIWRIHDGWRFYGHRLTYVLILSWVNIITRKLTKLPELSVTQKSVPVLRRAIYQDISLAIVFFFFSQTKLVLKFNLALVK